MVTKSLCDLLNKTGYTTDALENSLDVLKIIKDTHIDLIVVDIKMPEINGVQLVKKVKEILKSKNKPDIPVVFITGYPDSQEALEAKELGEVVSKPFDNQDFLDCISHYT
jgi:CheY-like chemotaxis protein